MLVVLSVQNSATYGQNLKSSKTKGGFIYTTLGTGEARYLLKGQRLTFDNGICGYFPKLLKPLIRKSDDQFLMLDSGFFIQKCLFLQNASTVTNNLQECPTIKLRVGQKAQGYLSENEFKEPLIISGLSGKLGLNGNQMPYFLYSGSRHGSLDYQQNSLKSIFHMQFVDNSQLDILHNKFSSDTARVIISNSKIDNMLIFSNLAKYLQYDFSEDSIGYFQSFGQLMGEPDMRENAQQFIFDKCVLKTVYINAKPDKEIQNIRFTNCTFLPDATVSFSAVDTVALIDCNHTAPGLRFFSSGQQHPVVLKIKNSDLTNIRFDYNEDFTIYQWSDSELTNSLYEQLLTKFDAEKRKRSYKRVDIEYFRYRNNAIVNFMARVWWNYGYDKWYILIWTFGFLITFTLINTFNWKIVRETYPVGPHQAIERTRNMLAKSWKIFIYTSIIFFSLKVDFEKLSFKKTGPLTYFFCIYLCGLLCLFFIANAILKI